MRIDLNTRARVGSEEAQPAPSGSRTVAGSSARGEAVDTAKLSLDQARVQSLTQQINRLPDIRQEKVVALGQAIAQGRFQVTPEQTAEAMISEVRSTA